MVSQCLLSSDRAFCVSQGLLCRPKGLLCWPEPPVSAGGPPMSVRGPPFPVCRSPVSVMWPSIPVVVSASYIGHRASLSARGPPISAKGPPRRYEALLCRTSVLPIGWSAAPNFHYRSLTKALYSDIIERGVAMSTLVRGRGGSATPARWWRHH